MVAGTRCETYLILSATLASLRPLICIFLGVLKGIDLILSMSFR